MRQICIFTLLVLFSTTLFAQNGWDNWKPYSSESYYGVKQDINKKAESENYDIFNPKFYVARMQNRFLSVDRFAHLYPSLTPYHYAMNSPIIFVDVNGDTVVVSDAMGNSQALQNFANTKVGYSYLSQFAYKGQTVTINGQEFTFGKAGDFGNQNLVFAGHTNKSEGLTVPITTIGGLELKNYVGDDGNQSYEIFIDTDMTQGRQLDAIFEEVQHSSMFASGQFRGSTSRGSPTIAGFHHGAMMQGSLWQAHTNFISEANRVFNANINVNEVWQNTLWNTLPSFIARKVAKGKIIRY